MELNRDDLLLLIQEYEKHPVLWDPKNVFYFNKNKKADSWSDIAKRFNINEQDAKKKISSLLGSFRREKAKGKKLISTGKATVEVYKSEWFAFKNFAFLMDKNEPNYTLSSEIINDEDIHSTDLQQTPDGSDEDGNLAETTVIGAIDVNKTEDVPTVSFRKPSTPTKKRARKARSVEGKEDPRIQEAFQMLKQSFEPEDSALKFAKYLADKLNQFDGRTKAILTHKINELIFEYEMKLFSNSSHTSYSATHIIPYSGTYTRSGTSHSSSTNPLSVDIAGTSSASQSPIQSPASSISPLSSPSPQSSLAPSPGHELSLSPTYELSHFLAFPPSAL